MRWRGTSNSDLGLERGSEKVSRMKCPLSWKDGWVWAAQTRGACSRQRGKHLEGPEERQKMAHSVTSSTSAWLEGKVQEEKCQELKLKKFKKKKRQSEHTWYFMLILTHLNFIIRMMANFKRVLIGQEKWSSVYFVMLYYTLEREERSQGKTRKASEAVIKEPMIRTWTQTLSLDRNG